VGDRDVGLDPAQAEGGALVEDPGVVAELAEEPDVLVEERGAKSSRYCESGRTALRSKVQFANST
jgi:hypothetical protein